MIICNKQTSMLVVLLYSNGACRIKRNTYVRTYIRTLKTTYRTLNMFGYF